MRIFLLSLLRFFIFGILLVIGLVLLNFGIVNSSGYFKLPDNTAHVILGDSHSECAYNDSLIENTVNFSRSGESYIYSWSKLKKFLDNNEKLKNVILEFENNQLDTVVYKWTFGNQEINYNFPVFFPIMQLSDINFIMNGSSGYLSNIEQSLYVDNIKYSFVSMLNCKRAFYRKRFGGYLYLERYKTDSLIQDLHSFVPTDTIQSNSSLPRFNVNYLHKIIDYCNHKKVKLYLVRSPIHPKSLIYKNEIDFERILKDELTEVDFLDFSKFPLSNDEFGDLEHLNFKGARRYSIWFDQLLKQGLLQKQNKQSYIDSCIRYLSK